jgi:hypothetical protein
MRSRCLNPNASNYAAYGGSGITICDRWLESFENFLADMGECPPGMTVERKDNLLGYSPENCRWATKTEQNQNTSATRLLEYQGESLCVAEWAKTLGIKATTIMSRLNAGWSTEEVLGTPVRPSKTYKARKPK